MGHLQTRLDSGEQTPVRQDSVLQIGLSLNWSREGRVGGTLGCSRVMAGCHESKLKVGHPRRSLSTLLEIRHGAIRGALGNLPFEALPWSLIEPNAMVEG